jgi:hypothetical protein
VSELLKLAAQRVIQEALEQEVTDYLGRERYARRNNGQVGWRNGYEPGRIRSAEGETGCTCRRCGDWACRTSRG